MKQTLALTYARFLCHFLHYDPPTACGKAGLFFHVAGAELWRIDRKRWIELGSVWRMWRSHPGIAEAVMAAAGEPWTGENVTAFELGECRAGDVVRIESDESEADDE